jgi:hypothetical protein
LSSLGALIGRKVSGIESEVFEFAVANMNWHANDLSYACSRTSLAA